MQNKTHLGSVLIATTSFLGGIAAGFLLAPKSGSKNRKWVSSQATEFSDWMDLQRKTVKNKTGRKLHKLRNNFQRGYRRNIPDLYEATETIDFSNKTG